MSERKRRGNSGGKSRPVSAGEKSERDVNSISRTKNSGVSSSYNKTNYQRTNSHDKIRKLVEEEGRTARNLVAWSVPFEDSDDSDGQAAKARSPRKPKPRSSQRVSQRKVTKVVRDGSGGRNKPTSPVKPAKKVDVRARYWAFLFDNLQRAVDEIYQTCEADESIVECKEVIMMLKNCTRDFQSLIERIQLQTAFENTEVQNRPTSLAWEVRKTSPGKPLGLASGGDKGSTSPVVNRSLSFAAAGVAKPGAPMKTSSPSPGSSWADKVKGAVTRPAQVQETIKETDKEGKSAAVENDVKDENIEGLDDGDGWETVQRKHRESKQNKPRQLQSSPRVHINSSNGSGPRRINEQLPVPRNCKSCEGRTRADSEKENEPERICANVMTTRETKSASELEKDLKATLRIGLVIKNKEGGDAKLEDVVEDVKDEKDEKDETGDKETGSDGVSKDDISGEPATVADSGSPDEGIQFSAEGSESATISTETQELAAQLHSAMVAVLDEETLTTELEKCHEEALASAIEEEANLTKEIEEEESKEINVETENEEDSDLGNTASSMELSQRLEWNDIIDQYDSRDSSSWGDIVELEERTPGHALHMHEKLSSPSRKRTRAESQRRHEEKQEKAHKLREKLTEDKKHTLRMLNERINEVRAWKAELYRQKKKEMDDKLKKAEEKRMQQIQAVVKKAQEEEAKVNEIAFINSLEAQIKRLDIMTRHEVNEARLQDIQEERQRKQEEKAAKEDAAHERRKALEEERLAKLEMMQRSREDQASKINYIRLQRDQAREDFAKEKAREREMRLAALDAAQKAKEEEIQKKIQQKHDESSRRHSKLIEERRERAMELSTLRHFASTDIAPQQKPYERKKRCTLCNVLIPSEVYLLSHLHGRKHKEMIQESLQGKTLTEEELENHSVKHISDAPEDGPDPQLMAEKERQRAFRKRSRKIRQRMTSKGKVYDNNVQSRSAGTESENKAKLQKVVKDINKYLQTQGSGPWPANRVSALDRALGEIARVLDKKVQADQLAFCLSGGLTALSRVMLLIGDSTETKPLVLPVKTLCSAAHVFNLACRNCFDNCVHMLCSNKLGPVIDMLMHRLCLLIPDQCNSLPSSSSTASDTATAAAATTLPNDPVAAGLMQLISTVLSCIAKTIPSITGRGGSSPSSSVSPTAGKVPSQADTLQQWGLDIVSYLVCVGVVDKLTSYFHNVHGPVDEDAKAGEFLENCLGLLVSMTRFITTRSIGMFDENKKEDTTQLMVTLKSTQFAGIISMLYGILLHGGAPSRSGTLVPPELPEHTLRVVNTGLRMMNTFAMIDLKLLQSVLGEEGISLEFRHIATYLIWYCSHWTKNEELCHEVMLIVGYFTVLDHDNQLIVQSGNTPTLLQQLCSLPFQYFSDPRLMSVLFPTLIACCFDNAATKKILEQEMSCSLLASFIEEKSREKEKLKIIPSAVRTKEKDKEASGRMSLESRFPGALWDDAKKFFEDK